MLNILITPKRFIRYTVVCVVILGFLALLPSKARAGAGSEAAGRILVVSAATVVVMIIIAVASKSYSHLEIKEKNLAVHRTPDLGADGVTRDARENEYKFEVSVLKW